MEDKELLKLAAKAAGVTNRQSYAKPTDSEGVPYWNPLTDDGDALRLAVLLGLEVVPYYYTNDRCQTAARATKSGYGIYADTVAVFPDYAGRVERHDPYAATRRAIARAAAEIGKDTE